MEEREILGKVGVAKRVRKWCSPEGDTHNEFGFGFGLGRARARARVPHKYYRVKATRRYAAG